MRGVCRVVALLALAAAAAHGAPADQDDRASAALDASERVFAPSLLVQPKLKWWQTAIVYQIYPASYKDSNDDGVGDIPGITSQLDYLSEIGVGALWLSPIFKSPNKDMGYDISDYKDIHPSYGTLEDFDKMVQKAHSLDLKVILDFVPNHSSDEHRWFQEALKSKNNTYHDYYVWHDGIVLENGTKTPPNNWMSVFDQSGLGTAWKYVPSLDQYYLRTFHEGQPDLNYNNPAIVREMKNVFRFWARRGVDGFRIDAIPYLFEDPLLRDNPYTTGSNGQIEMGKKYTENLPKTYDMVRQWREVFDEEGARLGKDLVMMLEAYASEEETMEYFGTKDQPAGHFPFNFFLMGINNASKAQDYAKEINKWNEQVPPYGWSNWVMGNHDNHRVGSRVGENLIDAINMLLLMLPGTAVTYYGEEIGMTDHENLSLKDCKDPQACPPGADENYYKDHTRDYERTPFHWDSTTNAGFTNGTPWLPVAANYVEVNVENQKDNATSHLGIYKKLAELRKLPVIQHGNIIVKDSGNVLTFLRQDGRQSVVVLINVGNKEEKVNVWGLYGQVGDLKVEVASNFNPDDLDLRNVVLGPYASVVLRGDRYKWWQTGIIYQIYPRTFKDSNEDGSGDFKGITEKLDHLKTLGVSAIWLSPVFESGNVDGGYDIKNFTAVDEEVYGNLDDFKAMVEKAHDLGLKVLLDFVPNHSSDQHVWFEKSLAEEEDYEDFYVWRPSEDDGPPNRWTSVFGGKSAWTYREERKMWYYHKFHEKQPDLNYRNERVVEEMKKVMEYWLSLGVDGFRVDAVQNLFEDVNLTEGDEDDIDSTNRDQPETIEMVKQWRKLIDEQSAILKKDLVLMLEVWGNSSVAKEYYGEENNLGAHFPFNFWIIELNDNITASRIKGAIKDWKNAVPEWGWHNWVIGNHDKARIGSRAGTELIDAFNMLVTLLPGTAITYNGEEIGMEDNRDLTIADCRDDQACPNKEDPQDGDEELYQKESRDFQRTPFQWDNTTHAGFCESCEPWLKVNADKDEINREFEFPMRNSHLFIYRRLANLRKEAVIQDPTYPEIKLIGDDIISFVRQNESYAYLVAINFGEKDETVNLAEIYENIGSVKVYVASPNFVTSQVDLSALTIPKKSSVVLEGAIRKSSTEPEDLKWWQKGIIYQIYPRSFQDSDGDGIGDLTGITSRLQYLKDLGVAGVWLSPIFKSPDADMGYDISDFTAINDYYGNLDDFDEMLQEAHRLGLKVILDFVPNHSSDMHRWFQDVLANGKSSPYFNYYVWHEEKEDGGEPNNWVSAFKENITGSAWSRPSSDGKVHDDLEKLYYLHQFHEKQPDLNYRDKHLVQEMKDVLSFWIRRGVDGFRVDAIQHLVEDADFEDNTEGRDKQLDQEETIEIVKQWRDLLDREGALLQKDIVLMLEVYSNNPKTLMSYFGSDLRPAGDFPFNFYMIRDIDQEHPPASQVLESINKWLNENPRWSNWVVGNHDNHRVGSRVGEELIDAFNMLVVMLPGTAITYQGEEIGMLDNTDLTIKDCQDPQACIEGEYESKTRDYERTPFQWDDSEFAGFSTTEPWLPINSNYDTINVKSEEKDPKSHLNVYKKLAALRREGAIQRGQTQIYTSNEVLVLQRSNATHVYILAINFGERIATIDLSAKYEEIPAMLHYVSSSNFQVPEEEYLNVTNLSLRPYSSVVLTSVPWDDGEDFGDVDIGGGEGGGKDAASTFTPLGALVTIMMTVLFFIRA